MFKFEPKSAFNIDSRDHLYPQILSSVNLPMDSNFKKSSLKGKFSSGTDGALASKF